MRVIAIFWATAAFVSTMSLAHLSEMPVTVSSELGDLPTAVDQMRPGTCGEECRFTMCNTNGTRFQLPLAPFTILGAPGTASTPYVCRPNEDMGLVLESGEAKVRVGNKFVAISKWRPARLRKKFKSNFIRTYKVPFLPHSGIGRLDSTRNQWSVLHDRCMILPIKKYQVINLRTGVQRRVVSTSGPKECVAFRTTAPAIQVSLTWDTQDDLDLAVVEPDGDVINFRTPRSEFGKLNGDNNAGFCGSNLRSGKEDTVYFPNPNIEVGRYKVRVTHFKKCGPRTTNWKLRVVINGVLKIIKSRFSSVGDMKIVGGATFNWP